MSFFSYFCHSFMNNALFFFNQKQIDSYIFGTLATTTRLQNGTYFLCLLACFFVYALSCFVWPRF